MSRLIGLIKNEPALITGALQAVLALLSGTVVHFTAAETGAVLALSTAVLALIAAVATVPFRVSALTGFATALITLLVTFGVHGVEPGIIATVNGAIVAVASLVVSLRAPSKASVTHLAAGELVHVPQVSADDVAAAVVAALDARGRKAKM